MEKSRRKRVRIRKMWLPNPKITRAKIDKILRAFENACPVPNGSGVIQTELIRIRWEEIKRLQSAPSFS